MQKCYVCLFIELRGCIANTLSFFLFFLQNLPSTVVAHVLNPQPGEKILDLCAAPGGKTTHIAALMQDQVRISLWQAPLR